MGMLSSQPKRKWTGDDEDVENDTPEFALTEDDWPPTPPKPKKVIKASVNTSSASSSNNNKGKETFKGSVSSHSVSTSGVALGGGGWMTGGAKDRPATMTTSSNSSSRTFGSKPSFSASAAAASSKLSTSSSSSSTKPKPKLPLAPMFKSGTSSSSSSSASSSSRPVASSSTTSASSTGNFLAAIAKPKRVMPWEGLVADTGSRVRSGTSNFHTVGGIASSSKSSGGEVKAKMLTSESMNIKQKVTLSPEQQMVHKLVVDEGKNVFFTGSAGTGKSVLLREIIASLKVKYKGSADAVAVTASTGMAACNIGGTTIHSFAGIGLGVDPVDALVSRVRKNRVANAKWQRVKVLVVDEVSMVDGELFDKLAAIAQAIKKKPASSGGSFGGIQLVVTGDFFQLPPVTKRNTMPNFAFEAKAWRSTIDHTVNLRQVFRQKDTRFIDMLNEMRFGTLSEKSIATFRSLSRDPNYTDGLDPTELFPMRDEVERANQARLRALRGDLTEYIAEDWCVSNQYDSSPEETRKKNTYLQNFMAPQKLQLKIDAQVMLIKNLDTSLVNGTIGKIVGFTAPGLEEDDEDSLNAMETGEYEERIKMKANVAKMVAMGKIELAPVIDWRTPGGIERQTMKREEFKAEDTQGKPQATRKQYPIILAWAMSIHKSQGQTLPRVKVDLGKVFEKGQSYVALSRATSLDGLQILRFTPDKVAAHPKVVQWSKTLQVLDL